MVGLLSVVCVNWFIKIWLLTEVNQELSYTHLSSLMTCILHYYQNFLCVGLSWFVAGKRRHYVFYELINCTAMQ